MTDAEKGQGKPNSQKVTFVKGTSDWREVRERRNMWRKGLDGVGRENGLEGRIRGDEKKTGGENNR